PSPAVNRLAILSVLPPHPLTLHILPPSLPVTPYRNLPSNPKSASPSLKSFLILPCPSPPLTLEQLQNHLTHLKHSPMCYRTPSQFLSHIVTLPRSHLHPFPILLHSFKHPPCPALSHPPLLLTS